MHPSVEGYGLQGFAYRQRDQHNMYFLYQCILSLILLFHQECRAKGDTRDAPKLEAHQRYTKWPAPYLQAMPRWAAS
jgi:hypothetical protein